MTDKKVTEFTIGGQHVKKDPSVPTNEPLKSITLPWRYTVRRKRSLMSVVFYLVLFLGFGMIPVNKVYSLERPMYIGEYCWSNSFGDFLRIGITLQGDGHFTFSGITEDDPAWIMNGSLEVIGDSAVVTWTNAGLYDGGMSMASRVGRAVLDISTLDGPNNIMSMVWENGVATVEYDTDFLYSVSCNKNDSFDGVDKREELKRILKKYAKPLKENAE